MDTVEPMDNQSVQAKALVTSSLDRCMSIVDICLSCPAWTFILILSNFVYSSPTYNEHNLGFIDLNKTLPLSEEQREKLTSDHQKVKRVLADARKREEDINRYLWHGINKQDMTLQSQFFTYEQIVQNMKKK